MKKYFSILIYIVFAAYAGALSAQTKYTTSISKDENVGNVHGHSPIDNWEKQYTVTCHPTGGKCIFSVVDHGQFLQPFPVAPPPLVYPAYYDTISGEYHIQDIYVVDDIAFFCGAKFTSPQSYNTDAVWGYFKIPDLITGGGMGVNINFYSIPAAAGTALPPNSLSRLVAYPSSSGNGYDIVSFGVDDSGQYKIVEISDVVPGGMSPSTCSVAAMPFNYAPTIAGRLAIDDVVLTKEYVVFTASSLNIIALGMEFLWCCYAHKGNVVNEICDPANHNNYYVPINWESNNDVAAVALNDDCIALAYTHGDSTTGTYTTRIRMIDLATGGNFNSQEFEKSDKSDPRRMVYLENLKSIVLLDQAVHPSDFIFLDPFKTNSYAADLFFLNNNYTDLRTFGGQYYAASAGVKLYLHDGSAQVPLSSPTCPPDTSINVSIIPNIPFLPAINGTFETDSITSPPPTAIPNFSLPIKVDCYSFE